ncbi:hypothetical protein D1007_54278 [Hordeum vulgare]|nr:hypothetical protein D1007_54278 [Hordeum vulgare]
MRRAPTSACIVGARREVPCAAREPHRKIASALPRIAREEARGSDKRVPPVGEPASASSGGALLVRLPSRILKRGYLLQDVGYTSLSSNPKASILNPNLHKVV